MNAKNKSIEVVRKEQGLRGSLLTRAYGWNAGVPK